MQTKLNKLYSSFPVFINPVEQHLFNGFTNPSSKINRFLLYCAFSFLFIGFKFGLIREYGNATPFWDQWDAEAATLYRSWNDGTLTWKHLVEHHNEHRILTTRLLALTLLYLNKIWNPLLQMVVNACLHLMAVLLLNRLLEKVIGRNALPGLLAFSILLFSVPYGWENTLVGFQGQFYFVLLFSIAAIWLLVTNEPLSKGWWGGIAVGILAFFSLASGPFTFATGMFMGLIAYVFNLRKNGRQLIACAILFALFVAGFLLTPSLEHQAVYKAHSFPDFYHALKLVLGWPVHWNFLSAVIRNLPIGIFILFILWKRPAATDTRWFLFALCVWSLAQALSIAYGRAIGPLSPRYKDLHIIPIFINFACLLSLTQISFGKWRRYAFIGLATWMAIVLFSIAINSFKYLPGELAIKNEWNRAEEKNVKNYIATGNINYLRNKPEMHIPYPRADGLAEIIELPGVREFLPSNIRSRLRPVSIENTTDSAFIFNGYNKTSLKAPAPAWGSYNSRRDSGMGSAMLRFKSNLTGIKIEIPVTGYPVNGGMSLEIIQNGQIKKLKNPDNPGELWGASYSWINNSDFAIHVADSSTTSWLAIGQPLELGRLDGITNRLLLNYYYFIVIGGVLVLILIAMAGLYSLKQTP